MKQQETKLPYLPRISQAERLYERVVYHLTQAIVQGPYPPGSALPSEPELAAQFEVSRTVIREATRVLVAKGMILVKHGSGMRVRPMEDWDRLDSAILFARVRAGRDETLLRELFEVRRLIELGVVAIAAERRTAADLLALRAPIDRTAEVLAALDQEAILSGSAGETLNALDISFHKQLALATQNGLLQQVSTFVTDSIRIRRLFPAQLPEMAANTRRVIRDHERVLAAVEAQDPEASREALRAHIIATEEDVRRLLLTAGDS